ncbi:unnamed protein product, partial [Porites evermanni]
IHIICSPTLLLEFNVRQYYATVHISAFLSNMAESTDGKNLETQLKKVALASACTLTGPTAFEPPEPGHDDGSESVEDKVRKVRQDGSVYKWHLKEDDAGK